MRPIIVTLAAIAATASCIATAAAEQAKLDFATRSEAGASVKRGLAYLEATQDPSGAWDAFGKPHLGVTALVAKCFAQDEHYGPNHPVTKRAVAYLMKYVQPDGGIYVEGDGLQNYLTSASIMALAAMHDPAQQKTIKGAQEFLRQLQWDSGEGYERDNPWYGGQGYGSGKRPDLSNTQMMIEALHDSGLAADDPMYKKAMVFISRCQMLGSTNDQAMAAGSTDGGFVYSPANGGESKAGTEVVNGKPRLRTYGSMTYAGFKSMLYANVDHDDPRVKAAVAWIRSHYTLDHNPNMPGAQSEEGLYYYFLVFSKAMQAWGVEEVRDQHDVPHPWRAELCQKLGTLQRPDGSWVNEKDRWFEGNPHLVTAYAVLALQTALSPAPK